MSTSDHLFQHCVIDILDIADLNTLFDKRLPVESVAFAKLPCPAIAELASHHVGVRNSRHLPPPLDLISVVMASPYQITFELLMTTVPNITGMLDPSSAVGVSSFPASLSGIADLFADIWIAVETIINTR